MTINYTCVTLNGIKYLERVPADRPRSYTVKATDDEGNVYLFKTDGATVTARDWRDAEMINGNRYSHSDAWHDEPVAFVHDAPLPAEPMPVYFAYGTTPNTDDIILIAAAIKQVMAHPAQFEPNATITAII